MYKYIIILLSFFTLKSFTQTNKFNKEFLSLNISKSALTGNPNCFFADANKTIDMPLDGMFLYSSLNNSTGTPNIGYDNNENYIVTIKNQNNNKLRVLLNYFFLEENKDILKLYDGPDTNSRLIGIYTGNLTPQQSIISESSQITVHFQSNATNVSKGFRLRLDNYTTNALATAACLNSTPADDACGNAPLICNLNGYCGNTSSSYTPDNANTLENGIFCGSIENNSWLSFIASSTSATFNFNSASCQSSSSGIQALILSSTNCNNFTAVSNCQSQSNGSGNFSISTNVPLVPGQKYYIMVDGFGGNVCSYSVTAQSGVSTNLVITASQEEVCPGYSVNLASSVSSTSYTWTSSTGGTYLSTQSINVTPTVTTTYSLQIAGGNACFPTGSAVKTITVTNTLSKANITPPSKTCMGGDYVLSSLTGGGTYNWTGPSGYTANTQNATITNLGPISAGIYTLVINYGPGCATAPATVNIVASPIPTVGLVVVPTTICSGQTATLTASGGSGLNPYWWDWDKFFGSNSVKIQQCLSPFYCPTLPALLSFPGLSAGPVATAVMNQTEEFCVFTENAAGCIGSTCQTITVLPSTPGITVTPTNTTICSGSTTTLSVAGGASYTWTPSNSLSSNTNSVVTANPTVTTTYTVSSPSCGGTVDATVTVNVSGSAPPTPIISGPTNLCANATSITYSITNNSGSNYAWTVPSGASITSTPTNSNSITVDFNTTGGNITVSETTTCGTFTASIAVTVVPSLSITVSPNNPTICAGSSTTLTATGATNYTWTPALGLNATNSASVIANPAVTTTYSVAGSTGSCVGNNTVTVTIGTNLSINVSPTTATVCPNQPLVLQASGADTYTWSPTTTLSSSNGTSVTATPNTTTTYTINGSDAGGCTGTNTVTIVVNNNLPLSIAATSSSICPAATTTLTAIGASNYTWTPSNSLSSNSGSVVIANPNITTTYTLVGVMGTCSNTISTTVNVSPNPTITVTPSNTTICVGDNVTIISNGANTYTWSPGTNLNTTSGNVVIANPTSSIVYTVSGTSLIGCSGTNTISVIVNPSPTISISAPTNSICAGTNATLTATGANSYTWSPAGSLSSATTSTVTANPITTTVYTITGVNGNNCQASSQYTLTVIPAVTATISPSDSVCLGSSIPLTISGGNSYTWTPSSSLDNSNSSNPIASPSVNTTYTVNVSNGGLCFGTATVTIFVNPLPLVNAGNDVSINIGDTLTLNGTGTGVLEWINASGLSCTLCPKPTAMPIDNTCYTLQAINNHNCTNIDVVCVEVTKDYALFFPNTFTPDGDLLNDEFLPKGFGISEVEFFVFDRWGELIYTGKNLTKGWDGKYKGKMSQNGVYPYTCTAKTISGKQVKYAGYVTLLTTVK